MKCFKIFYIIIFIVSKITSEFNRPCLETSDLKLKLTYVFCKIQLGKELYIWRKKNVSINQLAQ